LHPNKKISAITWESCYKGAVVRDQDKGTALNYPPTDIEPEMAQDCQIIRDSYDPNDKSAVPTTFLPPGSLVEYTIRFQNTGSDTAYTVVVVDTLDTRFDIASLQITSKSHYCKTSISGTGQPIVSFTFSNIYLVDSTTNEPKSHGYVKFRLTPFDTVPQNSVLKNKAGIRTR